MDSLLALSRCACVGTAAAGTEPGSVKDVFTCDAKASEANILYNMAATTGTPPVLARKVMVKLLYPIKTHTKTAMIVPAVSDWFNQMPCSSDVPILQLQDRSLKESS